MHPSNADFLIFLNPWGKVTSARAVPSKALSLITLRVEGNVTLSISKPSKAPSPIETTSPYSVVWSMTIFLIGK